ncbi:CBS domain-containing protein, partial [Candidatus Woesearchaeota archaeon]|nr:CBS domain-containing protein [Candidatus Woesearchaeota archaeon]
SKTKLKNLTKKMSKRGTPFFVPKIKSSADLTEICRLFASADTRALPVFEKDKLVGVITARTVLRKIKAEYKGIAVSELAKRKIITIDLKDATGNVIKTMNRSNVDRLPVVGKLGKIAGIVTEFDILKRFHKWPASSRSMPSSSSHDSWSSSIGGDNEKQSMLKLPVDNIMTPYPMVTTANIKSTITEVLNLMIKEDVNSIILTDNNKPAGILTVQDVMLDYARG